MIFIFGALTLRIGARQNANWRPQKNNFWQHCKQKIQNLKVQKDFLINSTASSPSLLLTMAICESFVKIAMTQTLKANLNDFRIIKFVIKHWALLRSMLQTNVANRFDHEAQKLSANKIRVRINLHKTKCFVSSLVFAT